jgi:hypothetical protein
MAKWLEQLRKNSETAQRGTFKTLKTHIGEVSKVLRVSSRAVSEKFPPGEETGFEGFEGTRSEHLRNYSGEKSENAPEANLQNRQNPHCDHCQQHGATISKSIDWPDGQTVRCRGLPPDSWHTVLAAMEGRNCPEWISLDRWQEVISDAETFLSRWGSAAHSLGWTALDLFGVHPSAPAARFDVMGLLLLVQGGAVVALTADAATIRRKTGAVLTYRRPTAPGAILISAVRS